AAHDRVGFGGAEGGGIQNRQGVRRDVTDRGGDDQRPGGFDRGVTTPFELLAAAPAEPGLGRAGRPRHQLAGLAGDQPRLRGGERGGGHRETSASGGGGVSPSTHSSLCQSSRSPNVTRIAGMRSTSPPTAYMPIPGSTVASSAILISATSMPSNMTSSIDHVLKCSTQRSISLIQNGAGERRDASSRVSMKAR